MPQVSNPFTLLVLVSRVHIKPMFLDGSIGSRIKGPGRVLSFVLLLPDTPYKQIFNRGTLVVPRHLNKAIQ